MSANKREAETESNGDAKRPKKDENCPVEENSPGDSETTKDEPTKETASVGETKGKGNGMGYKITPPATSGELLFCGASNWDLVGRKALPKGMKNVGGPNLWGPHRIAPMQNIRIRTVVSGTCAGHCVAITDNGTVYTWGRNDKGQLGLGNVDRQDVPQVVEALEDMNVVDAACGRRHTLFLTETGSVFGCGENKMGQLGLGNQSEQVLTPASIRYTGPPIRRISCGGDFSVISAINGNAYSFGCPEYGQLGHNTDGKYFVTSNKIEFQCETSPRVVNVFVEKQRDGQVVPMTDVSIQEIVCGANHVLAMDDKGRVFSWGFGGYGRLGHAEPKDEMVPRLVKFFDGPNRGAVSIAAGSTYSLAVGGHGALYFWGLTKMAGEATMYPKMVQDLSGWKVRSIGTSNKSIVVAADESVVSWGPSPCYGELGYGEGGIKSSTVPKEVKPLDKVYVHHVSCGYSHTMMIARVDSDEDKEAVDELPVFTP